MSVLMNRATKLQQPLWDLVIVECLSQPLRGILVKTISLLSLYRSVWYKRAARSLSLFPERYGNGAEIWLRCLAVMKLRVETRIVCNMIMMC